MGRLLVGLSISLALVAAAGESRASGAHKITLEEQALRDFYYRFTSAWNQNDPGRMARLWAKDGDHISADGRVAKGRPAVEALFADQLNTVYRGSRLALTLDSVRFISPEVAIATGGFELTGIPAGEGRTLPPMRGLHTDIWNVQDGEWQIVASRSIVPLRASARTAASAGAPAPAPAEAPGAAPAEAPAASSVDANPSLAFGTGDPSPRE
jgi:uncharacterized protein (TIGR02246 family)